MDNPYIELNKEGHIVREFSYDTDAFEFVWHRDKEDRYVETLHKTDWKFQFDNKEPQTLTDNKLFIPKNTYHRLIKGTGNLKVKIYKV